MTARNWLIGNILMFSIFEIYMMVNYLNNNKPAKFFRTLLLYLSIISLLLYEYYLNLNIPSFIVTCSLLAILGHTFLGTFMDIYHKSKTYDRYLHLFGSFSFSLLSFSLLKLNLTIGLFNTFLFVMTLGISLGVVVEIAEFAHDTFTKKPMTQHGLIDTDFDMISNVLGSTIAGIVSLFVF